MSTFPSLELLISNEDFSSLGLCSAPTLTFSLYGAYILIILKVTYILIIFKVTLLSREISWDFSQGVTLPVPRSLNACRAIYTNERLSW